MSKVLAHRSLLEMSRANSKLHEQFTKKTMQRNNNPLSATSAAGPSLSSSVQCSLVNVITVPHVFNGVEPTNIVN